MSNELGANHPRTAKFSLVVAVITSTLIGVIVSTVLLIFRNQYPSLFVGDEEVIILVKELTPILALSIVISNVQPVLSGNPSNYLKIKTRSFRFDSVSGFLVLIISYMVSLLA